MATGEVSPHQPVIHDDERFRVVLDLNLNAHGQMIIVYKPDRADFTELMPEETAALITLCTRVANAITQGLGAEKVYLLTMCDGEINHLHVQLRPRYPGEAIGSKRLVGPRPAQAWGGAGGDDPCRVAERMSAGRTPLCATWAFSYTRSRRLSRPRR